MGPPGVPRVPISGPNRGMFSKLNEPSPLGPGGHSHTIFGNGRFQGAQRSFGCDVPCYVYFQLEKWKILYYCFLRFHQC